MQFDATKNKEISWFGKLATNWENTNLFKWMFDRYIVALA